MMTLLLAGMFISCNQKIPGPPPVGFESSYPNVCQTEDGFIMIWTDGDNEIAMSEFTPDGWSPKKSIISSERFFKYWADLPQIYYLGGDTLAVSWLEMIDEGTYDYGIFAAVSFDRGQHWSEPIRPHRDTGKGEHGFLSFFKKLSGELGLIWLDGRHMGEYNPISHTMGDMALITTGLFNNLDLDEEYQLDDRVCECCPTDAIEVEDGILIAYRNRSGTDIRNINLIRFSKGEWSDPYPVFEDGWTIPGCPVNGPALDAYENQVAIAWFTSADNTHVVKVAYSKDNGILFETPIQVVCGTALGRIDVLWLDDESVLVSWVEERNDTGILVLKKVNNDGSINSVDSIAVSSSRGSGYPKLAKYEEYIFITWTDLGENSRIRNKWITINN